MMRENLFVSVLILNPCLDCGWILRPHYFHRQTSFLCIITCFLLGDNCSFEKFHFLIDDYAKDGSEELFTKMHCVLITNP